jgi:P-type Cu+ transporter
MTVEPGAGKPTSVFGGRTYHFCSESCKQQFEAEPERYVDAAARQALALGHAGRHE